MFSNPILSLDTRTNVLYNLPIPCAHYARNLPPALLGGCAFLNTDITTSRYQIGAMPYGWMQTRRSATQQDQMPVNAFWRIFRVLLPNCPLFRQNGFPSWHLILLDLRV